MTKKILFILLISIISIFSIQCSKESKQAKNQKNYTVQSHFFYSSDAGETYGDSIKEFKVGKTVYMKVDIEVYNKKSTVFSIAGILGGVMTGAAAGAGLGTVIPIPVINNIVGGVVGGIIGGVAVISSYFFTSQSLDFVECKLIIPNITSVDAKYYDGTIITPLVDEFDGITTYPIKIGISDKKSEDITNLEWSFTFQFIPNKESEISMRLIFDDNIAEQYDRMNTIKFVK